ncbi:MAG: M48 family metallopeptidase [Anaerolineales bacterium]|nr:M48 family metallopeptidase [Anaerolineales bacterium]
MPIPPASRPFSPSSYRYPGEHLILGLTLGLVLVVIAATATATVCGSVLFVGLMVVMAYSTTRAHHGALMARATAVTPETAPSLWALAQASAARLGPEPVQIYVAPNASLNAYTFGLSSPKVVVLNSALLQALDADEVAFVLSHELGHVRLGHTWLNSLVGGLAGIPSPAAAFAVLHLAFMWWNRACEHSADRAGLLATANANKAISALAQVEARDAEAGSQWAEALATHPLMARRIAELRQYAASAEYRRLATTTA